MSLAFIPVGYEATSFSSTGSMIICGCNGFQIEDKADIGLYNWVIVTPLGIEPRSKV